MRADHRRTLMLGLALVVATACNPILGPTPTDANWRIQTMGRFTFHVRPGSFAEANLTTLSEVLDDQFAVSVSRLDMRYQGHITMFLHNSGADAGFGKDAGGGDHSGVAYPETETVKAACVPPLDGNLFSLLSHEANHVIIRNGLGRPGTTFINEGLASAVLSERYHALGPTFYYTWAAGHRAQLPRLTDLIDDAKWETFPQADAYSTSASFLAYVIQVYGVAPLKAVYYATSGEFPGAFRAAYGRPLEEIEAEWKAWVR
jgi:hypothetical protein